MDPVDPLDQVGRLRRGRVPCALVCLSGQATRWLLKLNSLVHGRRAAQKEKAPIRPRGLKSSVEDRTEKGFQTSYYDCRV